jgi:rod shape-determining protein MreD
MRGTVLGDAVRAALATVAAFALYSLVGGIRPSVLFAFNAFSLIVVTFSVGQSEVFGAVLGSVCGLVQDSFSLGIFGVAGLTKTLLGFWIAYVSRRIDVVPFFRTAFFLLVVSFLELILWSFLNALVLTEPVDFRHGLIALQPIVTAVVASLLLHIARRVKSRRA